MRRPIAASPTSCSSACRSQTFGNRLPQLSFEVHRSVDPFEGAGARRRAHPRLRRVRLRHRARHARRRRWRNRKPRTRTRARAAPTGCRARPARGDASQCAVGLARGGLVRRRSARRRTARSARTSTSPTSRPSPIAWSVAGLTRATAPAASARIDGRAAYGGTPSDQTVVAAIQDLNARGLDVMLTPFILMDIAAGNALPDPYTGGRGQPAYPWRGRITVDPAPGQPGTPDKTAAAATQLAAFVGTAAPADFSDRRRTRHLLRPRRMVAAPHGAALRALWPLPPAASMPSSSARSCAA